MAAGRFHQRQAPPVGDHRHFFPQLGQAMGNMGRSHRAVGLSHLSCCHGKSGEDHHLLGAYHLVYHSVQIGQRQFPQKPPLSRVPGENLRQFFALFHTNIPHISQKKIRQKRLITQTLPTDLTAVGQSRQRSAPAVKVYLIPSLL